MFPGKWDDISSLFGRKHEFGRPTRDHCRGKTGDWGLAATTDRWWRVLWDCQPGLPQVEKRKATWMNWVQDRVG